MAIQAPNPPGANPQIRPNLAPNVNAPAAVVGQPIPLNPNIAAAAAQGAAQPGGERHALLEIAKMPVVGEGNLELRVTPTQLKELRDSGKPQNAILAIDLEAADIQRQRDNLLARGVASFDQNIKNAEARLAELQAERAKIDPTGKAENMVLKLATDVAKAGKGKFDANKDNPLIFMESVFSEGMKTDPKALLNTLLSGVSNLSPQDKTEITNALTATGEQLKKQGKDAMRKMIMQGGLMALIAMFWSQFSQLLNLGKENASAG